MKELSQHVFMKRRYDATRSARMARGPSGITFEEVNEKKSRRLPPLARAHLRCPLYYSGVSTLLDFLAFCTAATVQRQVLITIILIMALTQNPPRGPGPCRPASQSPERGRARSKGASAPRSLII